MIKSFAWKPALLRSAIRWRLENGILTGPDTSIDLANVTSLRLVDYHAKGFRIMRLDVLQSNDVSAQLPLTVSSAISEGDPDFDAFWGCLSAISDTLAARDPALPVTIGEAGKTAWIIFAVGALAALGGVGLLFASIAGLGGARGLSATLVPILTLIGFGLAICTMFVPWRKRASLPVSTFTSK